MSFTSFQNNNLLDQSTERVNSFALFPLLANSIMFEHKVDFDQRVTKDSVDLGRQYIHVILVNRQGLGGGGWHECLQLVLHVYRDRPVSSGVVRRLCNSITTSGFVPNRLRILR